MDKILISIIIPVYNVEKYLHACLNSVIVQTYDNYEIICINDGSTDDSWLILDEYSKKYSRIKIISQENKGLGRARNVGIKASNGEYLLFLDSDDWIEKNTLEILAFKLHREDLICFGGKLYHENTGKEELDELKETMYSSGWDYYNAKALKPYKFAFVTIVLRLYKKELLLNHSLFFKEGIFHEDNLFTPLACYYAQSVKVIPDYMYYYRIRPGSIMHTKSIKNKMDMITVANTLSGFFIPIPDIKKQTIYRAISQHYMIAFLESKSPEDKILLELVNWKMYRTVAQTKFRHYWCYSLIKISPSLFRIYVLIEKFIKQLLRK